jgi:hypothetical protein
MTVSTMPMRRSTSWKRRPTIPYHAFTVAPRTHPREIVWRRREPRQSLGVFGFGNRRAQPGVGAHVAEDCHGLQEKPLESGEAVCDELFHLVTCFSGFCRSE